MSDVNATPRLNPPPRYRWPWMILAAAILATVLAVFWMSREVDRIRRIRDLNAPTSATNASPIPAPRN